MINGIVSKKTVYLAIILVLLSGMGVWTVIYTTSLGPGLSPDSATYLGVADSIIAGHGFYIPFSPDRLANPMTHYPPLYPLVLGVISFIGGNTMSVARQVNALSFGALILLVGFMIYRVTRGSLVISILGATLLSSAKSMLIIHSWAWTEPLFLLTGFAGLFLFSFYLEKPKGILLILASVFISLAFLLRYSGIAFCIVLLLGLLLFRKAKLSRRMVEAAVIISITFIPMLAWMYRNERIAGTTTNRLLVYHPITLETVKQGFQTILRWLVPSNDLNLTRILFPLISILILGSMVIYFSQRNHFDRRMIIIREAKPESGYLLKLLLVFLLVYPGFLILSISFYDAYTPLDERILSPAFIPALILILWVVNEALLSLKRQSLVYTSFQALLFLLALFVVYGWIMEAKSWVSVYHIEGLGVNSRQWHASATLAALASLPQDTLIYSNAPDVIYPLTKRHSIQLPWKENPSSTLNYTDYTRNLYQMWQQLQKVGGVIVYFNDVQRPYLPDETELNQMLSLKIIKETDDGLILAPK